MFFRNLLSLAALIIVMSTTAQVKELIIIEGGSFGAPNNKVQFSTYNPKLKTLAAFDSIPGDFAHGIAINGHLGFLYVGNTIDSLNFLCKYDLRTKTLLKKVSIPGVQNIIVYKDKLLITKGYPLLSNFFAIYNQSDLSLVAEINKINQPALGITVLNNKAYIAIEGSGPNYTDSGTVGVLNLKNNSFEKMIRLDTFNKVIHQLTAYNGNLYFFGDSLITTYKLKDSTYTHHGLTKPFKFMDVSGNKLFIKVNNKIQTTFIDSPLYMPQTILSQPTIIGIYDALSNNYFGINTDYFSFGHLLQLNIKSGKIDTTNIKIAAESMALYENASENYNDQFSINTNSANTLNILKNDSLISSHKYNINLTKNTSIIGNAASIVNNQLVYNAGATAGKDTLYYDLCDSNTFQCTNAMIIVQILKTASYNAIAGANPSFVIHNNILRISNIEEISRLRIYNTLGQTSFSEIVKDQTIINLQNLPEGIYYIQLNNKIIAFAH